MRANLTFRLFRTARLRDAIPVQEAAIWGLFLALSLVVTWPLALNLTDQVIGPFFGDNLEYIWKLWWVKHAILDLGQAPWIVPDVYYPYGYPLAFGEITPIHTFLGLPITAVAGPITAYNLFILASISLTGGFTYLYVRELTASRPAGLLAGMVFAFCPYRMARIAGHLPLVDTQWIPLFLLFLERFLRRPRRREAALAGVFFAFSALSSWYYGFALGLLTPLYLLARRPESIRLAWRPWVRGGWPLPLVGLGFVVPFLIPYRQVVAGGENHIPLEQAVFWAASVSDYLIPNPRHVLWGEWVQSALTPFPEGLPYEFILGWGLVPTLLGWFGWRRGRDFVGPGWGRWVFAGLLLSLGPALKIFGLALPLPLPGSWMEAFGAGMDWLGLHSLAEEPFSTLQPDWIAIPLPALVLRWYVPGLAGLRSWGRFAVLAVLGVAVLSGAGVAAAAREEASRRSTSAARWSWALSLGLSAVIFFEFYPRAPDLITPQARPVDRWLAAQPKPVTLVQMPLVVALSGPQMFYSMHHGQRTIGGYGTYFPILFEELYPELADFPSDSALDVLETWGREAGSDLFAGSDFHVGVDFVLLDQRDVPADDPLWDAIAAQPRLDLVHEVDGVRVYTLP